ncbi:MAG: alpha/beta hydrolase [Cellulosilyticaceae bacterium]
MKKLRKAIWSMKKRILVGGLVSLVGVIGVLGFLIAYIPSQMSQEHTNSIVELYFEDTGYVVSDFEKRWGDSLQAFELRSGLGHSIPGYYILPENNYENKTIVLVHWHESNHQAMYPIAEVFLEKGWNVVLYDQRAHGKNTAKTVTFGYLESQDLAQVIAYVKEKSVAEVVGILGQSMGAVTVAYYLGDEEARENIAFAVVDSAYSSMYEEIAWELTKGKYMPLANGLTSLGSQFCKLLYGYAFEEIDMETRLRVSDTPILMIHSRNDQKCLYYMGEKLFEAIPNPTKRLVTFENADHLFCFWDEQERYIEEVFSFIERVVMQIEK